MILPGRAAGCQPSSISEEICRSAHVARRKSDMCQSHSVDPERVLGCELLKPFLIILNNRYTSADYRVARGNDDHAKSRRDNRLGSHRGSYWLCSRRLVQGAEPPVRPSLEHDILPLLKARCQKCHGPIKPKGKLNLSSARSLARGGESGPVVVPGNLGESLIWDQVSTDEMPPRPGDPLSCDGKGSLAPVDRTRGQEPSRFRRRKPGCAVDRPLGVWTTQKPSGCRRCPNLAGVQSSIDCFIQSTLEGQGLSLGSTPIARP